MRVASGKWQVGVIQLGALEIARGKGRSRTCTGVRMGKISLEPSVLGVRVSSHPAMRVDFIKGETIGYF